MSLSKNARNPHEPAGRSDLGDPARTALPQLGDQPVFFLLPALHIQREHGLGMKLQGIFADITTPFDHKGDIYKVKFQHNVETWNRTTLAGYVVCGAAGEGDLLATTKKSRFGRWWHSMPAAEKVLIAASPSRAYVMP